MECLLELNSYCRRFPIYGPVHINKFIFWFMGDRLWYHNSIFGWKNGDDITNCLSRHPIIFCGCVCFLNVSYYIFQTDIVSCYNESCPHHCPLLIPSIDFKYCQNVISIIIWLDDSIINNNCYYTHLSEYNIIGMNELFININA